MILRFGVFELDETSGELRRSGVRIRVQEQPLRILRELLDRRGEIVTREELRTKIWGETFVDYDRALNTAIRKLRDALSDSAEAPRYVETISRKGYRFLAPVERVDNVGRAASPPYRGQLARGGTREEAAFSRARAAWPAAVLVLAVLATLGYYLHAQRTPGLRSIAVLPFANLTGSAAHEYVADGVTDALISDLARMPALRVISRTSVMQYKQARKPLPKIASELWSRASSKGRCSVSANRCGSR
jgi:DNA-binding winged helix-turn-helix (wHTH) protein